MRESDLFEDSDDGTVFRDVIMLALLGFVTIVVLLLPHLNPPAKAVEAARPPGNMVVEVRWPNQLDADVDLWVQAPGDVPVGYSNRGGHVFNLLRDDLGQADDLTGLNYEVAFTRGMPSGKYTINLHLYRYAGRRFPIPVMVSVSTQKDGAQEMRAIVTEEVDMTRVGQEITVTRFALDGKGKVVPGSMNKLPKPLRSAPR